jgi:hypothetical protein
MELIILQRLCLAAGAKKWRRYPGDAPFGGILHSRVKTSLQHQLLSKFEMKHSAGRRGSRTTLLHYRGRYMQPWPWRRLGLVVNECIIRSYHREIIKEQGRITEQR